MRLILLTAFLFLVALGLFAVTEPVAQAFPPPVAGGRILGGGGAWSGVVNAVNSGGYYNNPGAFYNPGPVMNPGGYGYTNPVGNVYTNPGSNVNSVYVPIQNGAVVNSGNNGMYMRDANTGQLMYQYTDTNATFYYNSFLGWIREQ